MSGNRYLFDTNAVVFLLKGNRKLLNLTAKASSISISIISYLEFLSFPNLTKKDADLFKKFARKIQIVELSSANISLLDKTVLLRKKYGLKLPDAIICASSILYKAKLVTCDRQLKKIKELKVIDF